MNFYNDNDPFATRWLENLIAEGHIPDGTVDRRSIHDITAADLEGYTQVHLFAGIAGWSRALELAGWPAGLAVWTGSCPCQPYTTAGTKRGSGDHRDLWPEFARLIRQRRPEIVFGEQVEYSIRFGWMDRVQAELEAEGYTVWWTVLGAHSVLAPHIRRRVFWAAFTGRLGIAGRNRSAAGLPESSSRKNGNAGIAHHASDPHAGGDPGFWDRYEIIQGVDKISRRTEPGVRPLAHGLPNRVGQLRAYGNAIVPQIAAEFIEAVIACNDNTN